MNGKDRAEFLFALREIRGQSNVLRGYAVFAQDLNPPEELRSELAQLKADLAACAQRADGLLERMTQRETP